MSVRARIGALLFGPAFLLGAAEARAAPVCGNAPGANDWVYCQRGDGSDIDLDLANRVIATTTSAHGVFAYQGGVGGRIDIDIEGGSISTTGAGAYGVFVRRVSPGDLDLAMTGVSVVTTGAAAWGIQARHLGVGGNIDIDIDGGSISTTGAGGGVYAMRGNSSSGGVISIGMKGGVSVATTGGFAHGIEAFQTGGGGIDIDIDDASIAAAGARAHGVYGNIYSVANTAALSIDAAGDSAIAVEGLEARGILGRHRAHGSVEIATGAGTEIEAPFAFGMEARMRNDENAAGRLTVTHAGEVEARDVGVQAWALRASGHTFDDGAQTADDAARTAPMIHVVSTGDIAVGASVMDAFIRGKIAGADETLSDVERAILGVISKEDSDARDTALAALFAVLPAAYDEAWKAEARNLARKRAAAPTSATVLGTEAVVRRSAPASRAAEEILGFSRAGIRASALSHAAIADYIRQGDRDPAILAIDVADRTAEQVAALAEQEKLSAAERTVLEAVLTGGDLKAALAALPAAWTDAWKDGVRQRAASYNAGDIHVDVTGGSISAGGNGVEALYAVPHDRNGAIAVTVAEGARVAGGRNGIYVRGAGAGEGNFRAQSVTVNGAVEGGTGAGVYMAGGGKLTIGARGEVGAASGVGVLADGAGDLDVTVSGAVGGGVAGEGAGAHKVTVESSGAVAGTVRLPTSETMTISGKVGRVHYDNGGAVTVNASGNIAGLEIEGVTEAIRSAAGDLTVAVHGTVTGNIEALGDGDLTVTVSEAGTINGEIFGRGGGVHTVEIADKAKVLGTVHNPKSGTVINGVAGRVLFDNGGALTVSETGRISGVGGEAIRADAGALEVTVAKGGAVTGRIEGRGAGGMDVDVRGAVTGAIHGKDAGKHEVTVASGGVVTGDIIDLDAGDLVASVAGRLAGSIEERGAGDLTATVTGMVTGGIRGMGAGSHTVSVREGGSVAGTVQLPTSAMTIAGRVGSVVYDNGGSVTVAATGSIAGVERSGGVIEAIRSAAGDLTVDVAAMATVTGDIRGEGDGDLDVDVSGTVKGRIFGLGAGEHDVHVEPGGSVEGLIHLEASTVTVDGSAGGVRFESGGTVAVGAEGRISGTADAQGRRVAVVAEAGALRMTVDGKVEGAVDAPGAAASTVTVGADGAVDGRIVLAGAGSAVTVDGAAQSVDVPRGAVTVGENGRIEDGVSGAVAVTVKAAAGESDEAAVARAGRVEGGATVAVQRAGADGAVPKTDDAVPEMDPEGPPAFGPAPRHRVYEALPSALLALNALSDFGGAPVSTGVPRGAFVRLDAGGGDRRPASSTAASRHDMRRFGFEAGMEGAVGENGVIAVSAHHVRGRADVETEGGRIEIAGTGARVSGSWFPAPGFYASGRVSATLYEADLDSALDGALASDVSGRGYAADIEIGRRVALDSMALTPRAGAAWSQVDMSSFTDSQGERISLDAGRRVTARAGLRADAGGIFATMDIERELSGAMDMTAADMSLEAEAEATWLRLGLGGAHEWADGRFVLRGAAHYAAAGSGNRDFAGSASLTVRF